MIYVTPDNAFSIFVRLHISFYNTSRSCLSGSEGTNSMEECITTMKLVFLSIFTPMDRQKCFTRMERWLLNSRDRKIENVIIEVKYQRVLIGIDNLVESCKLIGRGILFN